MVKSKFAISTHILTFLAKYDEDWVTSGKLASSININPVLVRKELSILKDHGLIESREGKHGGVKLAKPAKHILLSEIFILAKGDDHILGFSKNDGNPNCDVGRNIKNNLTSLYTEIDTLIELRLSKMTLAEFTNLF